MSMIKYRVHEVAKDFKMNSKTISDILTQYATTPKNHMQVLEDFELSVIFEYLTQHNQIESIADVYAMAAAKTAAAPKKEEKAEASKTGETVPAPKKEEKPHQPKAIPQKRIIDTSGVTLNIDKYDERLDTLVPERAHNMKQGKEKIKKQKTNLQEPAGSMKRKQREKERMQKLQLEIAKKAPLKVQIPEEISVGELASRMKKTGAEVV